MTAYNAVNGCYADGDEELLQGIFREELGFEGYFMTDWGSYDTTGVVDPVVAGNTWLTPGSKDDTFTAPIVKAVEEGKIDIDRLRDNVSRMLRVIEKRTGTEIRFEE